MARRAAVESTIAAGMARGLADLATVRGADRRALLHAAGLSSDSLDDQDRRVPFSAYVALMGAAKAMTGDRALALHYGEAVDVAEFSIVGPSARLRPTSPRPSGN